MIDSNVNHVHHVPPFNVMRVCDLLVIALVVAATFKPLPIQAKTSKWAEGEFRKAVDVVAAQKGIAAHTISKY